MSVSRATRPPKSDALDRLTTIGAEFETDGDLPKLCNAVLTASITATAADFGNIQLIHPQDGALRIVAQQGFDPDFLDFFRYVKLDKSACSAALRERRRVIVRDVARSRVYTEPARRTMLGANARACQSTPIVGSNGRVLGIISTHFRVPHRPTVGQLAVMDTLARALADLIGKATPSQPPSMDVQHIIETFRDASHDEIRVARASTAKVLRHRHGMVRVLIADADDDTRSRLGESLTRAGCDVVDALDGRDALVKALSQRPTLVMTEARLPILDGYALCDVLRRDSVTQTVPILVVTEETRPLELDRARRAGANAVLSKPVTPEALLAEVQRLLDHPDVDAESTAHQNERRRTTQAKAHLRAQTSTPPVPPAQLTCPSCDRPLQYQHSYLGGVSRRYPEQWDTFACVACCGTFEYRQRTRKLRRVS